MVAIALAELEIKVNPDTYSGFYRTLEKRSLLEPYIRRVMGHLSENPTRHNIETMGYIIKDPCYSNRLTPEREEILSEEEKEFIRQGGYVRIGEVIMRTAFEVLAGKQLLFRVLSPCFLDQ